MFLNTWKKKNPLSFFISILLICVESLVTESADGNLEHLGLFPPVTLMPCLCQALCCWLSAEGDWAGRFTLLFPWAGTLRNDCLTELHITSHKMAFPFSSWRCDPIPGPALQHLMLIKAEIWCFSARMVLAASQSWLIFSPWNKLAACRRPYEHNGYIFHNIANTDILLWHIKVQQSTFPGE